MCGVKGENNRVCTKLLNGKKWDVMGTVAYRGIFFCGGGFGSGTFSGVQQIQVRIEGRENGSVPLVRDST
jgi:hypothetical protein